MFDEKAPNQVSDEFKIVLKCEPDRIIHTGFVDWVT